MRHIRVRDGAGLLFVLISCTYLFGAWEGQEATTQGASKETVASLKKELQIAQAQKAVRDAQVKYQEAMQALQAAQGQVSNAVQVLQGVLACKADEQLSGDTLTCTERPKPLKVPEMKPKQ